MSAPPPENKLKEEHTTKFTLINKSLKKTKKREKNQRQNLQQQKH